MDAGACCGMSEKKQRRIGRIGDDGIWRPMPEQAFRNAYPDVDLPFDVERPDGKIVTYVWEPEESLDG